MSSKKFPKKLLKNGVISENTENNAFYNLHIFSAISYKTEKNEEKRP